jgi:hypothetical protein
MEEQNGWITFFPLLLSTFRLSLFPLSFSFFSIERTE